MAIEKTVCDNGLTILTKRYPSLSVSTCIGVDYGSIDDPAEINGVAHYTEHMLFKGTKKRSYKDITDEIKNIGGNINAGTSHEYTYYVTYVPKNFFGLSLDILSDMFKNSAFGRNEFETERGTVQQELLMYLDNPQYLVDEYFSESLFEEHPAKRPIGGTSETVNRIRREDVLKTHKGHYTLPNMVVSVVGNIKHDRVVKSVKQYFDGFETTLSIKNRKKADETQKRKEVIKTREGSLQSHIVMGFKVEPFRRKREDYALDILMEIFSDRLFEEIREKRGLAYHTETDHYFAKNFSFISGYAGTSPKSEETAKDIILKEYEKLKNGEIEQKEFRNKKNFIKNYCILNSENTLYSARRIMRFYFVADDPNSFDEYPNKIEEVTIDDVKKVADKCIDIDNYSMLVIKPKS